jgi:hypothetical protein
MHRSPSAPGREYAQGQALVLVVLAFVAVIGMAALVIDGGAAFAQQRRAQNWTDSAANAGAVQLMRRLVGVSGSDAQWDARVVAAVNESIGPDGLETITTIEYTDVAGSTLGPAGGGSIPTNAAGVHVVGDRSFSTFFGGILAMLPGGSGAYQFTATAEAVSVTGYSSGAGPGSVVPVTFPVLYTQCDGNDLVVNGNWPVGPANRLVVPMCSNGPGNVGWIDWTPTAGGASELAGAITTPSNPAITTPKWYYVTQTGSVSAGPVQTAMESWIGKDILLPIFYADEPDPLPGTCNSTPGGSQTQLSDCPISDRGGTGSNQWYYLVTFASFHLEEVYLNGGDAGACNPGEVSGGNISGCLIGYFTADVAPANLTIGPGGGSSPTSNLTPPTVQLIR